MIWGGGGGGEGGDWKKREKKVCDYERQEDASNDSVSNLSYLGQEERLMRESFDLNICIQHPG